MELSCYGLDMPLTSNEAREELRELLERDERDVAWMARNIGKSYQWTKRRIDGVTRMWIDDYGLMLSAFEERTSLNK